MDGWGLCLVVSITYHTSCACEGHCQVPDTLSLSSCMRGHDRNRVRSWLPCTRGHPCALPSETQPRFLSPLKTQRMNSENKNRKSQGRVKQVELLMKEMEEHCADNTPKQKLMAFFLFNECEATYGSGSLEYTQLNGSEHLLDLINLKSAWVCVSKCVCVCAPKHSDDKHC